MRMNDLNPLKIVFALTFSLLVQALFAGEGAYASPKQARKETKQPKEVPGEDEGSKKNIKWTRSKYGLGALIDLSKDRNEMIKVYNEDTKRYKKLNAAIQAGTLKKGDNADKARIEVGEPVVIMPSGETEEWIYKPGYSTFFGKEKIYLRFDGEKRLAGWTTSGEPIN
ncbi:MAG: hypothetical protein HQL30_06070 [Candidatus Omnitrophica bacterium]|nr:hypothetical protein [Candidatus Omnitrophota bacterium]